MLLANSSDTVTINALDCLGKLMLSVDKDTFEELGLQGKCSRYQKHRHGEQMSS